MIEKTMARPRIDSDINVFNLDDKIKNLQRNILDLVQLQYTVISAKRIDESIICDLRYLQKKVTTSMVNLNSDITAFQSDMDHNAHLQNSQNAEVLLEKMQNAKINFVKVLEEFVIKERDVISNIIGVFIVDCDVKDEQCKKADDLPRASANRNVVLTIRKNNKENSFAKNYDSYVLDTCSKTDDIASERETLSSDNMERGISEDDGLPPIMELTGSSTEISHELDEEIVVTECTNAKDILHQIQGISFDLCNIYGQLIQNGRDKAYRAKLREKRTSDSGSNSNKDDLPMNRSQQIHSNKCVDKVTFRQWLKARWIQIALVLFFITLIATLSIIIIVLRSKSKKTKYLPGEVLDLAFSYKDFTNMK